MEWLYGLFFLYFGFGEEFVFGSFGVKNDLDRCVFFGSVFFDVDIFLMKSYDEER